jgi:hypothetical protein
MKSSGRKESKKRQVGGRKEATSEFKVAVLMLDSVGQTYFSGE